MRCLHQVIRQGKADLFIEDFAKANTKCFANHTLDSTKSGVHVSKVKILVL